MPSYSGTFTLSAQMQATAAGLWTAPPGVPTSVVASAGSGSASISFTAPTFTGIPAGITSYTVTSSGGQTATGASSPITVTGLTNGTAYTFTVAATGASGTGAASAASNSVTPAAPSVIGQVFGGGYYAGAISTTANSVATHYLVVGPLASAATSALWATSRGASGGSSVIDGPTNSAFFTSAAYPAGFFCENLTIGGFTDWYMPAKNELEVCYYNLKPTTSSNTTNGSGVNPNAVPARASGYTSGNPTQTSAVIFRSGNSEAFGTGSYWSSTYLGYASIARQIFSGGYQNYNSAPNLTYNVRAVRRVAV